ncbi:hypothetical protein LUPAC06_02951 [Micromonospora saelicesensis]|nr:hypothetical protein LUPAC06_02951 [Micromonospora saelicesensis]
MPAPVSQYTRHGVDKGLVNATRRRCAIHPRRSSPRGRLDGRTNCIRRPASAAVAGYRLVELCTLGGDSSSGVAMNTRSDVVGCAQAAEGTYCGFL